MTVLFIGLIFLILYGILWSEETYYVKEKTTISVTELSCVLYNPIFFGWVDGCMDDTGQDVMGRDGTGLEGREWHISSILLQGVTTIVSHLIPSSGQYVWSSSTPNLPL